MKIFLCIHTITLLRFHIIPLRIWTALPFIVFTPGHLLNLACTNKTKIVDNLSNQAIWISGVKTLSISDVRMNVNFRSYSKVVLQRMIMPIYIVIRHCLCKASEPLWRETLKFEVAECVFICKKPVDPSVVSAGGMPREFCIRDSSYRFKNLF